MIPTNPITEEWISAFVKRPSASALIDAPQDVRAAKEIAEFIASKLVSKPGQLTYLNAEDKNTIGVERIRSLKRDLSLRADLTERLVSRILIIEEADKLTIEAQNALLKLIEELPNQTVIVLFTAEIAKLLPTVVSRCFRLPVLPVTLETVTDYTVSEGYDEAAIKRAHALTDGKVGLLLDILESGDNGSFNKQVSVAKEYMSESIFNRQLMNKNILKSSQDVEQFLQACVVVSRTGMRLANRILDKNRWKHVLLNSLEAQKHMSQNVSTKLVLLNLSVTI
jgi:hypothetical protein